MKHISLRELRGLTKETHGQKLPSAKALRGNGTDVVASAKVGTNGVLTVYRNGFYTYSAAGSETVYALDRCLGYAYDGGEVFDASFFEDKEWMLCLMVTGEDRLEHNGNRREEKARGFSLDEEGSDRGWSDGVDFILRIEDRDMVDRMLQLLTVRQRRIMEWYFVEGLTQQQIADCLMIRKQVVSKHIQVALERLRVYLEKSRNGG